MAKAMQVWDHLRNEFTGHYLLRARYYSSMINWNKIRPMIHKRIQKRSSSYPLKSMVPIAYAVLQARAELFQGVSALLKFVPMKACKFCPEVYIGEKGHLIRTCHGFRRRNKNQVHEWIDGSINDIFVPIEAFHLHKMFQDLIKHDQRFDFDRIPAVVELCCQAGANIYDENLQSSYFMSDSNGNDATAESSMPQVTTVAIETLKAWENLRLGVQRLLMVYPTKACKYCSEVHVGPSGHRARLCGVFKHQQWRGYHFWQKAEVDDLVPPKVVWRRRSQDPDVLFDEGRKFYGHAPAVVELCHQAGAPVPPKYHCIMKVNGLPPI